MQQGWLKRLSFGMGALFMILPVNVDAQNGKKTYDLKPVTQYRLLRGPEDTSSWLMYGGNYQSWRYSPLKDVNRQNVKKLTPAWIFQTGVPGQLEASPIIADGILYLTVSYNHL